MTTDRANVTAISTPARPDAFAQDLAAIAAIDVVPMILDVVCRSTGMGFSAIARVTDERWIACAVRDEINFGLTPGGELALRTTLCEEIRRNGEAVVIDHVAEDLRFRDHPTPALYGFQSFISVPIMRPGGEFFGTLCALDPRPALLSTPEMRGMFKLFADLIGFHLDAHDRLAASEAALLDASQTAELREQFIAVLGHDLRNPLAAVDAGTRILLRMPLDARTAGIVKLMRESVARMSGLVDNVLDFARGRLGGGMTLETAPDCALPGIVAQVIDELRVVWPDRVIRTQVTLDRPVACDRGRIAQLVSNLLANALAHGDPLGAVDVLARTFSGQLEICVANQGPPITAEAAKRMFQPFARGASRERGQGLGLGLYIASEIARAHGGTLHCVSTVEETRFCFRMPLAGPR